MSALRSTTEIQTEFDFGSTDSAAADAFMRLATPEDRAVPSPVATMQADLEAGLVRLSSPGRWPVGGVLLILLATGAAMWWAIIGGVLALLHG
jgi:hypothetical protein